ncbi:AbrB family transcriptional regulator [Corynebacterium lizhenjunii]|uniref:AbrB family transcriptional regulator n=1 Tax=Corynebacterium lizhenjunii TaxID=2709394 RepID=UPI0013ED5363|nr:AbrB family transcriptional regulator [Corynebacterium lizhenjunii]
MSIRARWALIVPASLLLGWALRAVGVPAAWVVAAIAVSGTAALATGEELEVNRHFYALARGFIGIMAGLPLTLVPARQLVGYVPAGATIALVTVLVGIAGGVALHRSQPQAVPWTTGILAMLPGGASMMPALAHELGADYRYVALTQYLRLLVVSITLPVVAVFLAHPQATHAHVSADTPLWLLLLTVAVAIAGEPFGRLLRLPAAPVLGTVVLTVAVAALLPEGQTLVLHPWFQVMALLSIGWVCGGGLSVSALRLFARQLPVTLGAIAAVICACALTAVPLARVLGISYFEAYLATSPGALETVLALAAEGGASAAVVALQLIRLILVLLIAGYLPQLLRGAAAVLHRLRRD